MMDDATPATEAESVPTLLERLGGDAAVEATVERFNAKNLSDPRIMRFFEGVDYKKLQRHQALFLHVAFGGKTGRYTGAGMAAAHARLIRDHGLDATHFDCVAENVLASLQELGVGEALRAEVGAALVPLRPLFPEPKAAAV